MCRFHIGKECRNMNIQMNIYININKLAELEELATLTNPKLNFWLN